MDLVNILIQELNRDIIDWNNVRNARDNLINNFMEINEENDKIIQYCMETIIKNHISYTNRGYNLMVYLASILIYKTSNKDIIKNVILDNNTLFLNEKLINIIDKECSLSDVDIESIICIHDRLHNFGSRINKSFYNKCCDILSVSTNKVCNNILVYLICYIDVYFNKNIDNIYQNTKLLQIIINNKNFDIFNTNDYYTVLNIFVARYKTNIKNANCFYKNNFYKELLTMLYNHAKKNNNQNAIRTLFLLGLK